jgi:SAM-dependent methyltransferase
VCPACGGPLASWREVRSSEPELAEVRYALRRCGDCGSAVTDGPVGDLHDSGAFRGGTPRLHALARPLLARFDAQGLEPSRRGIERGAARGVQLIPARIEQAEIEHGSLDAVSLWHVLEHVDRPAAALARIADWLAPGGGLLLGVPNLGSWQAHLGAARWFHLDVPRHRTHFTVAGVTSLLTRAGFAPVAIHHRLLEHNPYGMWQTAVNLATRRPSYLYNLLKRNAPPSARDLAITVGALALAPVAILAELLAGLAGRGGTIAALARRV